MAKNDNLKDFLTDLAEGIRAKKGTTEPINPQNFRAEIESIETGTDTTDATASENDILAGKVAYGKNGRLVGTVLSYNGENANGEEILLGSPVKVSQLPSNPKENIFYEVDEYTDVEVYHRFKYSDEPSVVVSLKKSVFELNPYASIQYNIVDEFPDNPLESDIQTFYELHIYILNDIAYAYVNMGAGVTRLPMSEIFAYLYQVSTDDVGYIKGPLCLPEIENCMTIGVSYTKNIVVELPNYKNVKVKYNGCEADYKKVFEKTIEYFADENVVTILPDAFYRCSLIKEVYIPNCIELGRASFNECTSLQTIICPNVLYIGEYAFSLAHLKSIRLEKIKVIAKAAFVESELEDIYLGHSDLVTLESINAFERIYNLVKIHVRSELVEAYQTATNWVSLIEADRIQIVGDYSD